MHTTTTLLDLPVSLFERVIVDVDSLTDIRAVLHSCTALIAYTGDFFLQEKWLIRHGRLLTVIQHGFLRAARTILLRERQNGWFDEGHRLITCSIAISSVPLDTIIDKHFRLCDATDKKRTREEAEALRTEVARLLLLSRDPERRQTSAQLGGFPLLAAAEHGHTEIVRILIDEAGASPIYPHTLRKAIVNGHTEVVGLLLDRGMQPEFRSDIDHAISNRRIGTLRLLLDRKRDGLSARSTTPCEQLDLCTAVQHGWDEAVTVILDRGEVYDLTKFDGIQPLLDACSRGYTRIALLLLNRTRAPEAERHELDFAIYAAMRSALTEGYVDTAQMLTEHYLRPPTREECNTLLRYAVMGKAPATSVHFVLNSFKDDVSLTSIHNISYRLSRDTLLVILSCVVQTGGPSRQVDVDRLLQCRRACHEVGPDAISLAAACGELEILQQLIFSADEEKVAAAVSTAMYNGNNIAARFLIGTLARK